MPRAFGSILGGMTTLIGTPPNIIIASYRAEISGEAFSIFVFSAVGLVVASIGLAFITFIGRRLIPTDRSSRVKLISCCFLQPPKSMYYVILTLVFLLTACDSTGLTVTNDSSDDTAPNPSDNHHTASFEYTSVADNVWPPQPLGVSNSRAFDSQSADDSIREVKAASAREIAFQNGEVIEAIGPRHEIVGVYLIDDKNSSISTTELEIFNYNSSELITVTVRHKTVSVQVAAASNYQPAETPGESNRAIALAAQALNKQGLSTVTLKGTALLQHPSATEVTASGKQFYELRILYVTFGQGNGFTPIYRATVDLSAERVLSAGTL